MPQTLAAMLPYIPPGLAQALLANPTLAPLVEQFPAAVLFADISGFTPLTETLAQRGAEGPEEMTRLLNAYFSRLIAAIAAEGGEVVKFSGDALTALFPATADPAGHATRRAVQAAAAMHALMGDFATLPTSAGPIGLGAAVVDERGEEGTRDSSAMAYASALKSLSESLDPQLLSPVPAPRLGRESRRSAVGLACCLFPCSGSRGRAGARPR